MPGMKCKQYKKINEYFDPDIDFGIKQYVADYQAVYLTFDIETSLMWQSGKVAKWQLRSIRNRHFARIFQSYLYQFLLNYHKCQCKYSENSLIITIFAVRFKCI